MCRARIKTRPRLWVSHSSDAERFGAGGWTNEGPGPFASSARFALGVTGQILVESKSEGIAPPVRWSGLRVGATSAASRGALAGPIRIGRTADRGFDPAAAFLAPRTAPP